MRRRATADETPRGHKYGVQTDAKGKAERTVDGILFASKREAKRYAELKLLERAGEIHRLGLQPGFPLAVHRPGHVLPTKIGEYRGDFVYCECRRGATCEWTRQVVEDVKGFQTPLYKWKKRHVEAQYGIEIREV